MEILDDMVVSLKKTWFSQRSWRMLLEVNAVERLKIGDGSYFSGIVEERTDTERS